MGTDQMGSSVKVEEEEDFVVDFCKNPAMLREYNLSNSRY
jgi:hypothetical protein